MCDIEFVPYVFVPNNVENNNYVDLYQQNIWYINLCLFIKHKLTVSPIATPVQVVSSTLDNMCIYTSWFSYL